MRYAGKEGGGVVWASVVEVAEGADPVEAVEARYRERGLATLPGVGCFYRADQHGRASQRVDVVKVD